MTKTIKFLICWLFITMFCGEAGAQLSGNYTVTISYPTLSAAITALNAQGVNGAVTINIPAGYTETAPAGGYSLTATGTAINTITFKKSGAGANPLINANTGTGTPATATQDGIWRFIGSDYITIDGIDLNDNNAANPATMEYGYGFFKANSSNGCQNNEIRNCTISLKVINNATGSGPAADGSRGINVVSSLPTAQTTVLTPTSAAGSHSNNKFYSNTIQNCNIGISLIGYAAPAPFTLADTGNDIGGLLSANGNTIINFGGAPAAANPAAGVRTLAQYNLNVSNNLINNNTGSGVNHLNVIRGIYVNTATSANVSIENNTLTINSAATAAQLSVIENVSGASALNNTVNINGNTILNCANAANATGTFFGIYNNGASSAYLNVNGNNFSGVNTRATTASAYLIYNTGAVTEVITVTNNFISNCTNSTSTSGTYYSIFNNVASPAALNVSSNAFTNCSSFASTGATHLIYNAGARTNSVTLNNNTVSGCSYTINSTGAFYGIFNNGASSDDLEISSNTFSNGIIRSFSGAAYLIYNTGAITNSISVNNNSVLSFSNSITSTGSYYGIYNNAASCSDLNINNNSFSGINSAATTGSVQLIFNRGAVTNTYLTVNMNSNLVSNCSFTATSSSPFLGIFNSGVKSDNLSMSSNTISSVDWYTTTGAKFLVYNTGVVTNTINLSNNLVTACSATNNTTGTFNGIYTTGACTAAVNMSDNTFSDVANNATTGGSYYLYNSGVVSGGIITMTNNFVGACVNAATGAGDYYGMFNTGSAYSSLEMSSNTFTNNLFASSSGASNLIYTTGSATTSINNISLNNNVIAGCTNSVSLNGATYGIYNNAASCGNLEMSSNSFLNNTYYANTGANHLIYNRGTATNTFTSIEMNNNLISGCSNSASSTGAFYSIWNNGVTSTLTSISNNTISAVTWSTVTGLRYLISNWGVGKTSIDINNNLISSCTTTNNTSGLFYGIYNNNNTAVSSGALTISHNTFTNVLTSASGAETHYINNSGLITNTFTSIDVTNNTFADCSGTVTAAGAYYGIYNNTASSGSLNLSANTFSNHSWTSASGNTHLIYNRAVAGNIYSSITANNNFVSGLTHSVTVGGTFYGILNSGIATATLGSLSVNSNTFTGGVSSGTSVTSYLMYNTFPASSAISFSNNLASNWTNTVTTTGSFYGINNGANCIGDLFINANKFNGLISTATTGNRFLIYNTGAITNSVTALNNLVSSCNHSITGNASFYGIDNNPSASGLSSSLSNNTFSNNSISWTSGSANLILNTGALTTTVANVSISNNIITSHTNIATAGTFNGLGNLTMSSANLSLVTNTVSNLFLSTTGSAQNLIFNTGRVTNTIEIENNLVSNFTNTVNTSGVFNGILNTINYANGNYPSELSISGNKFQSHTIYSVGGALNLIYNSGAVTNTVTSLSINNNSMDNISTSISGAGALFGIYNSAISSGSLTVISNTISNLTATTTTGNKQMIFNGGLIVSSGDFLNNQFTNITSTANTSGSYYGINNSGNSQANITFSNNSFSDHTFAATNGSVFGIYNSGAATNSLTVFNNRISALTHTATGSGGFVGIYNGPSSTTLSSAGLIISSNTFSNTLLTTGTGAMSMIYNRGAATNNANSIDLNNNLVSNATFSANSGPFYGIINSVMAFGNLSAGSNTFVNITHTTTTSPRYMIYNTGIGSAGLSIMNNDVSGYTSSGSTTGSYFGINNGGNQLGNLSVNGNEFLNLSQTVTSGSMLVIYNSGAVTNTSSISDNLFSNLSQTATTSGGIIGIYNGPSVTTSAGASLSINSNTFATITSSSSTGALSFIYNRGTVNNTTDTIIINNNLSSSVDYTASSGPFYGVLNNVIGFGSLSVNSNSFINTTSTASASARYFVYNTGPASSGISVSNNIISNYNSSLNATGIFYNIANTGASAGTLDISGNTFSTQVLPATTGVTYLISNTGAITSSVSINNNLETSLTHTSTTGAFYGLLNNGASAGNLSIANNTLNNIATTNSTGLKYLIYNTSAVANNIDINNNLFSGYTASLNTTGNFFGVYSTGSCLGNMSMSSNSVSALKLTSTTSTAFVIYNAGAVSSSAALNNNMITNTTFTSTGTGTYYGVYNLTSSSSALSMSGNTFSANLIKGTTSAIPLIYSSGNATSTAASIDINNNSIASFSTTLSSGTFYGLYNNAVSSANLSFNNNTFTNCIVTTNTSPRYVIFNNGNASSSMSFTNNQVSAFSSSINTTGDFYGLQNSGNCSGNLNISNNSITNSRLRASTGSTYLFYNSAGTADHVSMDNNTITGLTNSITTTGDFYGIVNLANSSVGLSMNANTYSNNILSTGTGLTYLLDNSAAITNSVSVSNNIISGITNSTTSSGDFYAIHNTGSGSGDLSMNTNSFNNNTTSASTANTHLIYNAGVLNGSVSISNNTFAYVFSNTTDYSGTLYNIYNSGGANTTSLNISNNSFLSFPFAANSSGNIYFINAGGNNSRFDLSNNTWSNLSLNHSGNEYIMYNSSSTGSALNVINNAVTGYTRTGTAGPLFMYFSNGTSLGTCTQLFSGNTFSNISSANLGTGSFYGIFNMDGGASPYPKKLVFNNLISDVNFNGLGFLYGYYFDFLGDGSGTAGSAVYSNTLTNISSGGPLYGLQVANNISPNYPVDIYSNTILNLTSSGTTADVNAAYIAASGGSGLNYYKNKISDLTATGTQAKATGLAVNSSANISIYNNLIGNIYSPVSNVANRLNGMSVEGTGRINVYYNTVYLNATNSGGNFSSNALYAATTVTLNLRNNVLINNSTPTGAGITAAYRRSAASLGSYVIVSNNNVFYAGAPSSNRVVFHNGVNPYITIAAFQTHVTPRDNASVSENTAFLSTIGTNTSFLHVDNTIPSLTESGAVNLFNISEDYDTDIRQGNPGYIGSGIAPDIGADEYEQSLIACNTADAGTISIPTSSVICEGENLYMLSTGFTAAGHIVHQWKVSTTPSGPYSNVSSGMGANTPAYTTGTLTAGTYYFVLVTTCTLGLQTDMSNELTVLVNPSPTASASISSATICSGQSLNLSGNSNVGTNYSWTGPDNFTSTAQNPVVSNAITNSSGAYSLTVSNGNCTSTPVFVSATVNPTPPAFTISPASASICVGASQTITASIPITSPTLNFGTQSNQNGPSGYPAPYSVYYGGQKMQILILSGELAAAGFTTGSPIHSIQFPVASLGANWNSTLFNLQNFMVGIKATTTNNLSTFETGISNVVAPSNYVPAPGFNNIHNFSSPFIWDGTSNIVVETVFSNNIAGTNGNTVIQYNSPTGFQSTLVYRADNQNVNTIAAATTSNVNVGFVRPDFKLNGSQVGTYSWSPSANLTAMAGASVVASPTISTLYTATLSDGQCASTSTVQLEVVLVPTVNISATSQTVCAGNNATLTASGATSYTWSTNSTNNHVVVAPFGQTVYSVTGSNPSCPIATASITLYSAPALILTTTATPSIICEGQSSTLTASGASNYTWTGGAVSNSITVTPNITTNYSVLGYNGPGCWTAKVVLVRVNALPTLSITPSSPTICLGESITFEASGVYSFTWTPGNSNSPIFAVSPVTSTVYSVLGVDLNGCWNTTSVNITVDPCVSVSKNSLGSKAILISPNPSQGLIKAEFNFEGQKMIRIENSLGALILERETNDLSENIDLSAYAKGVYFVRVKSGAITNVCKLIID